MVGCVAYRCPNKDTRATRHKGITFHRFPLDARRCRKWVKNAKMANWVPDENASLCSEHFTPDCFDRTGQIIRLRPSAVPTKFYFSPHPNKRQKTAKPAPKPRKRKIYDERDPNDAEASTSTSDKTMSPSPLHQVTAVDGTSSPEETTPEHSLHASSPTQANYSGPNRKHKSKPCPSKLTEENEKLRKNIRTLEKQKVLNKEFCHTVMSMDTLLDARKKYYTGLPTPAVLTWLANVVCGCFRNFREISPPDQLLLGLMKLRLGLSTSDLAVRFGIPKKLASFVVEHVIVNLACKLKFLISWRSKEVAPNVCNAFTGNQEKSTIMIECLDFPIEEPLTMSGKAQTWNESQECNTVKALLGATHYGLIIFVSQAWGATISNKELILHSGFLNEIKFGDTVMANRDFYIGDDLHMLGASFEIQSPELSSSKRVKASAMKKAFENIKAFKILSKPLPHSILPYFDDVLVCCAALKNLQP